MIDAARKDKGSQPSADVRYHNLAVWGFELADAYQISAAHCMEQIRRPKDEWFAPPSQPRFRTALKVLNPARTTARAAHTQIDVAREIQRSEGGIDHLIVWLGANNCLGTVVELEVRRTGDTPPGPMSGCTLWTPEALGKELEVLAEHIADIGARHVYLATVPHVTIPPITRGMMKDRGCLPEGERYFDHYTRFFIHDEDFRPERDKHLTRADAIEIDACIDAYNQLLTAEASRRGWHLVAISSRTSRPAGRGAARRRSRPAVARPDRRRGRQRSGSGGTRSAPRRRPPRSSR